MFPMFQKIHILSGTSGHIIYYFSLLFYFSIISRKTCQKSPYFMEGWTITNIHVS